MRAVDRLHPTALYERAALHNKGLDTPTFITFSWYQGGHFPHHDHKNPGMLRIHDPDSTGYDLTKDFITVKPGKFLTQHFSTILNSTTIASIANEVASEGLPPSLHFTTTREEIALVYEQGPKSCMQYPSSTTHKAHPCETYYGPDLSVAYLKKGPRIIARALCWPAKKIYGRCYGNEASLKKLLKGAGFSDSFKNGTTIDKANPGPWHGARCTPIPFLGISPRVGQALKYPVFLMPYSDHFSYVNYDSSGKVPYLIVCNHSECKAPHHHFGGSGGNNASCDTVWQAVATPLQPQLGAAATVANYATCTL